MSHSRRGLLLAGLALLLAALAASDVAGRESALEARLGAAVPVVVARTALAPGTRLTPRVLGVRNVPQRFAPAGAFASPNDVVGLRTGGSVAAGADLGAASIDAGRRERGGAPVRKGERVVDVVAVGSTQGVVAGGHVDVLVTRERTDRAAGRTALALADVEVLAVRPVAAGTGDDHGAARVSASLRVTLRQAVYLAAAQSFARELRLLPRAVDDRRRVPAIAVGDGL